MATRAAKPNHFEQWIWYGIVVIVVGLPFHAFLITWLGSVLPHAAAVLRYWKEGIFLGMLVATAVLVARDPSLQKRLLADRFAWLLTIFTLIHAGIYLVFGAATFAAILALKINLGFLGLYLVLSLTQIKTHITPATLSKLVLIPAGIVGAIGVLQAFFLPHDILTHFGYGPLLGTNPAYYLIENSNTIRVMSTLWGPNQFGSYLVFPIVLSFWWLLKGSSRQRLFSGLVLILDLLALYGSQSRGAWLAAALALITVTILVARGWVRWALGLVGIIALSSVIILAASHKLPEKLNILLLHSSATTGKNDYVSSNGGHLRALTWGFDRLAAHPAGAGLEAAGRASENSSEKLYTENFFLQLAVQIGYEGLFVFLIICGLIAWRLIITLPLHPLSLPLFAAFIGLSTNNLVAHTWSDGATAWIWWAVAGIVFAGASRKADHV